METEKKNFKIGELAYELKIKAFVIRFWEKEFNIKPSRTEGGQRFYTKQDFLKFKLIKELLYEKKFTIAGAKEALKLGKNHSLFASKTTMESNQTSALSLSVEQLIELRQKLLKIRELL